MARKTTKLIKEMIERHDEMVIHYTKVIEAKKRGDESPFFKEHSIDHYVGMACGAMAAIENAIHLANCYHGFKYVDSLGRPTSNPEEMLDWRISYIIKE